MSNNIQERVAIMKDIRKRLGKTQEEVAAEIKMDRSYYSRKECETSEVEFNKLELQTIMDYFIKCEKEFDTTFDEQAIKLISLIDNTPNDNSLYKKDGDKKMETKITKKTKIEMKIYKTLIHCLQEDEAPEDFFPLLKFIVEHMLIEHTDKDCGRLIKMLNFIRLELSETKSDIEKDDEFFHRYVKHMRDCWYCQLFYLNLRYALLILTDKIIDFASSDEFIQEICKHTIALTDEAQLEDLFEKTISENYKQQFLRRLYYKNIEEE